ncbi:transposase [Streptomyces sp. NPDC005017]|uniref:transposase n=1 Tax=Streptomyces sp. NPDC005017 TaxID=3364706 RepID=UPI00369EB071
MAMRPRPSLYGYCQGHPAPRHIEFNGEGDHSRLVNSLKGVSSRYLRAEYTGRINRIGMGSAFWAPSYFVGSCSGAPLSIVKGYIEKQKRPT